MVRIDLGNIFNINDYDELARMFLPRGEYELVYEKAAAFEGVSVKLEKARAMYEGLSWATGRTLPWGVLTGVKPVKLFTQLVEAEAGSLYGGASENNHPGREAKTLAAAEEKLRREYLVSEEKVGLLRRIYEQQATALRTTDAWKYAMSLGTDRDATKAYTTDFPKSKTAGQSAGARPPEGAISLYIGIPFCPTRCAYCTFTSSVGTEKQMREYLDALREEISFVGRGMKACGMYPESVYIGGGTPTALPLPMFEELLGYVREELLPDGAAAGGGLPGVELTVEAGRPDTITYEKAVCMARMNARVSVNPQTMNDRTLERIGRGHTAADVAAAFEHVRAAGVRLVNTDVIAGLPGEGLGDFLYTLDETMKLGAENITIHTLALKKGSALREQSVTKGSLSDDKPTDQSWQHRYYNSEEGGEAAVMLREADKRLTERGLAPYYLYRQKQTVGNLENVGYAVSGAECIYNMRMMQEKQTVVALGAGAVSKVYFGAEDRVERVFNVADTGLYIKCLEEMKDRKKPIFNTI